MLVYAAARYKCRFILSQAYTTPPHPHSLDLSNIHHVQASTTTPGKEEKTTNVAFKRVLLLPEVVVKEQ
jgi:hypothetical protein